MLTALDEVDPQTEPEPASAPTASLPTGDPAIDDLLAVSSAVEPSEPTSFEPEPTEDLLPAELLFPDLPPERRR